MRGFRIKPASSGALKLARTKLIMLQEEYGTFLPPAVNSCIIYSKFRLTEYGRIVTIVTNPERGFLNHQKAHFHRQVPGF